MKAKGLYKTAISHAEQEEEVLRKALQKITEIRNIKNERRIQARLSGNKESVRRGTWIKMLLNSAQTLPLFVGKVGEKPPPLCGAIPADSSYTAKVGDMVAVLVRVTEGDGDNWILAEVVCYNPSTGKYEVEDILKEQNQKERHTLSKRLVVPLPLMRANPETDPGALFPQGTVGRFYCNKKECKEVISEDLQFYSHFLAVLALYPQTTCFYKAIINKPPSTHTEDYEVLFEDPSYPDGYSPPFCVAQRYVIAMKQKTKQS